MIRINPYWTQKVAFFLLLLSTLIIIVPVILISLIILKNGISALTWEFLTESPRLGMRAGGIFPAMVNSAMAMHTSDDKLCAQLSSFLGEIKTLAGTGVQTVKEYIGLDNTGVCVRNISESVTLTIDGLSFTGNATFAIAPLPKEVCTH